MANVYVVVDLLRDWEPYYPSSNVMTFEQYLEKGSREEPGSLVINLSRSYSYLSKGYYTSLLAEARGLKVLPSIKSIYDLKQKSIYNLQVEDFSEAVKKAFARKDQLAVKDFMIMISFGKTEQTEFADLAWKIFETFSFPILFVRFSKNGEWRIHSLRPGFVQQLDGAYEDQFARALELFDRKIWRKPRSKRRYKYDLAILHNPTEKLPPSNKAALRELIRSARDYDIDAELVTREDLSHIGEYDGLFIRETTALNHYTYTFARKAENEGLVVIDSPTSILRCCNKVYLHEVLTETKVKTPKTLLLNEDKAKKIIDDNPLGFPLILKIPDGSFSQGVFKVSSQDEFKIKISELLAKSEIILAQEYMYTDFDWRVGVLDKKPLYACKYMMSKNHWQIYKHDTNKKIQTGGFENVALRKVPKHVLSAALKATALIGDGLYGVDLKVRDDQVFVIEVNDNPNIDHSIEDAQLGGALYDRIMEVFYDRLEERGS